MKISKQNLGDYDYNQQMIAYYNYASNKSINNLTKVLIMKSILKSLFVVLLLIASTYSSITMYLLNSTADEFPLTEDGINLYNNCRIILIISLLALFVIWLVNELKNVQQDDTY